MHDKDCSTWNVGPSEYPVSVAGCEQLDYRPMRRHTEHTHEVGAKCNRTCRIGLIERGYDVETRTLPVLPFCGPIAVQVDYDDVLLSSERRTHVRGMARDKYAHRGGQDAADLDLEQRANALLAFHYGDAMTLDVMREVTRPDGVTSGWDSVVKADRSAYRGKVRFQLHSHRYAGSGTFIVAGDGTCIDDRAITYVLGQHLRFIGHRAVKGTASQVRDRARELVRKADRKAVAKPPVEATEASRATYYRAWKSADDQIKATADLVESILRTTHTGSVCELDNAHVVTVYESTVTRQDGKAMGIREYARRAALAGVHVD